jgi:hypothetical protein
MDNRSDAKTLLITGAYGVGKTSLLEELAEIFEERGVRYAAIDLDWLAWFDPGSPDHAAAAPTMRKNVDAVVGNYYETGVRVFALAGAMGSQEDVDQLQAALGMPLTTVRLTLSLEGIERRLSTAVTSGRQVDLTMAREWFATRAGEDVGDLIIENDRPISEVALEVLTQISWLSEP